MQSKLQFFLSSAILLVCFFCNIHSLRAENFAGYERIGSIAVDGPVSVALDMDENLYVVQTGHDKVLVYDNLGVLQGTIANLDDPKSIAVGVDGRIYIGNGKEGNRKNVEVYDQHFTLLFKLGQGDGEFFNPVSIAVDNRENGKIYVVDCNMPGVKIYEKDGTFVDSFYGSDSVDGSLVYPISLTVDESSDKLIVIDLCSESNRVQIFDLAGDFVSSFGGAGVVLGDGRLPRPIGVDIDGNSNIFIVDSYQEPVQVFSAAGEYLGTVWDRDHHMSTNMEIAIGRTTGRLFIASQGLDSVEMYGLPDNRYIVSAGAGSGGSISPAGEITAVHGENLNFTITPDVGYLIERILVDGVSFGSVFSYVFTNVTDNHFIHADFIPRNGDNDGDGMANGWEYDNGLNPSVYDAFDDKDGDGYCNLREYLAGTQPNSSDDTPAPREIYVDADNVSAIMDGTVVYPFNTIQEGILLAADNDTVLVATGTYQENIHVGKSIYLIGGGAVDTIIDGSTAASFAVHCQNMSHGEISGFSITNGTHAGILCDNSIVHIRNNIISNTISLPEADGHGIAGDLNSSITIENNVFFGNDYDGIYLFAGVSAAIFNNTCVFNGRDGIGVADGAGVVIKNNIVVGNGNNGMTCVGATEPIALFNNVWSNGAYDYGGFAADGISADPLFVDAANGDYHLKLSSPSIDAGTSDGAPELDFEGNDRVDAPNVEPDKGDGFFTYYDIGAFEYVPDRCDLDGDGLVDGLDLAIFVQRLVDKTNSSNPEEFAAVFGR